MRIAAAAALLLAAACGDGASQAQYADIKAFLEDETALFEHAAAAVNKAESAGEIAACIRSLAAEIRALLERLRELEKNHPDLALQAEYPVALKTEKNRLEQASARLQDAFMKKIHFVTDQDVIAAFDDMAELIAELER